MADDESFIDNVKDIAKEVALKGGASLLLGLGMTTLGGTFVISDVPEKSIEGTTYTYRRSRRLMNDLGTEPWGDKLPKEERHPAVEWLVKEIIGKKERIITEKKQKLVEEGHDIKNVTFGNLDEVYARAMQAAGDISRKAIKKEESLEAMLVSAYKTGAPKDRSNKDINVLLEAFVDDISGIMKKQEFSFDYYKPYNTNANLACFSPDVVADNFLKITHAKVKAQLAQIEYKGDASDLGKNDDIHPSLFPSGSKCYEYTPFEFSPLVGNRPIFGKGMQ